MFDVYQRRDCPPGWPADVLAWRERILQDPVPEYGPALTDAQALDWWLPLEAVSLAAEFGPVRDLVEREEFAGSLGVILLWQDGTLYAGVPPQRPVDLLHLYWANRLIVDAYRNQGEAQALANWSPSPSRAAPN